MPYQVVLQIGLGVLLGGITARLLVLLMSRHWTQNTVQDTLVAAGFALLLVVVAAAMPLFSGYLAVMATGFFLTALDAPLARRLRTGFNSLWTVAEIVLFVLLGASIQLSVLENTFWVGLGLLAVGTLVGRSLGWHLSTIGSNWTNKERVFLLAGNSAKATVQAAIGAVPLARGIDGGEAILAISALSILVTAPLGAWAIPTFAPRLLERDKVDPTKVAITRKVVLLAAVDTSKLSTQVLTQTAELARRSDGEVVVLHVAQPTSQDISHLRQQTRKLLADIRHQFVVANGLAAEEIVHAAHVYGASEIVIGKRGHHSPRERRVGSVSQAVLGSSPLPVVVVEGNESL